jgi:hypothetical protein
MAAVSKRFEVKISNLDQKIGKVMAFEILFIFSLGFFPFSSYE